MTHISCAAACSAHSTLVAYEQTNKTKLTVQEQTNQTEPSQNKFDWEENSTRLRKLACRTQEIYTDRID